MPLNLFLPPFQNTHTHTHQSAGEASLDLDAWRSGARLYLHLKSRRVPLASAEEAKEKKKEEEKKKPSKLAFGGGVEGGFSPEGPATTVETSLALLILPQRVSVPLPNPDLPELVLRAVEAATQATSATAAAAAEDAAAAWEEGERRVSKYAADLPQLEEGLGRFGRNVPPNPELWECEASGMRENLWLNLSTVGFFSLFSRRREFFHREKQIHRPMPCTQETFHYPESGRDRRIYRPVQGRQAFFYQSYHYPLLI